MINLHDFFLNLARAVYALPSKSESGDPTFSQARNLSLLVSERLPKELVTNEDHEGYQAILDLKSRVTSLNYSLSALPNEKKMIDEKGISANILSLIYQELSDEEIIDLFDLNSWQTAGDKEDAIQDIIDNIKTGDEELSLNYHELSSLPPSLNHMPWINDLDLSNNHFTSLEGGLPPNLTKFRCANCHIETFAPNFFQQAPSLKKIDLRNNKIQWLNPHLFSQLEKLDRLHLEENRIVSIDEDFFPTHIENLLIYRNPIMRSSVRLLNRALPHYHGLEYQTALRTKLYDHLSHDQFKEVYNSILFQARLEWPRIRNLDLYQITNRLTELASIMEQFQPSIAFLSIEERCILLEGFFSLVSQSSTDELDEEEAMRRVMLDSFNEESKAWGAQSLKLFRKALSPIYNRLTSEAQESLTIAGWATQPFAKAVVVEALYDSKTYKTYFDHYFPDVKQKVLSEIESQVDQAIERLGKLPDYATLLAFTQAEFEKAKLKDEDASEEMILEVDQRLAERFNADEYALASRYWKEVVSLFNQRLDRTSVLKEGLLALFATPPSAE